MYHEVMQMNTTAKFIQSINSMKIEDLKSISEFILQKINGLDTDESSGNLPKPESCPICGNEHIVKFGKDKNLKQRYKCKSCAATFTASSFSVVSHTHCDMSVWRKYIELLLQRVSLRKCASECGISVQTAFIWRHKILNALQQDQDGRVLSGVIEADEMYFSISFKGNHTKSTNFVMPRKSYKRGTDSRGQISERACVMCAIERNGQTYGEVLGKGQPTIAMLSHAFKARLMDDSVFITDKALGMRKYMTRHPLVELIQLDAHTVRKSKSGPPEIRGAFHIQSINNLHTRFRRHMRVYNGVSTKYLNHYLTLFIWLENYKNEIGFNAEKRLAEGLTKVNTYIKGKDIFTLPEIPRVA